MARSEISRWRTLDSLFAEALERPADERTAFLRARCGDDPALYEDVLALLSTDEEAGAVLGDSAATFVEPLVADLRAALADEPGLPPGTRVGPYRIERLIGRGGMGNVYLAERADGTFTKQVALKLIRRGMDTDEVLARFRRERQLLAGLDHPNIARLLDGGASDDGRPYLVMELVEGEAITEYADRLALTIEQRIDLFGQVAVAVQAAHQRLIVHRDLKPSNVLVTSSGQVKLLDFGVARLVAPEPSADDPITRAGLRLLTPEYAAPEQLRGESVTTSADVYSLGVLLFELLVGVRPPPASGALTSSKYTAPPVLPSHSVGDEAAETRSTTTARLIRILKGDLDTIVTAALRPCPTRRYSSVEALVEDLHRRTRNLPVRARRDSVGYRAGRFVRRHRSGLAATSSFVLVLAMAVVALAVQQRATAFERDRAASELAQKSEVMAFLTDLFAAASPEEALGDTLTAYDLLARGVLKAEDLVHQPDIQAHLMTVLGGVYQSLGVYDDAQELYERVHAIRLRELGAHHILTAESSHNLASVLHARGEHDRAEVLYRSALDVRRKTLGLGHPEVAATLNGLGLVFYARSEYDAAEALIRDALSIHRLQDVESGVDEASALTSLANLLQDRQRYDEAEAMYREALAVRRAILGPRHPQVVVSLMNLSTVLINSAQLDEAEEVVTEALRVGRAVYGNEHPRVASALNNLGWLLIDLERYDEAEAALQESLEVRRKIYGDEHAHVATSLNALATLYMNLGALDRAESLYRESLRLRRALHGPEHRQVAVGLSNLGVVLSRMHAYPEAERVHREAAATFERLLGPENPSVAMANGNLGEVLHNAGRHDEAVVLFEVAARTLEAALDPGHPSITRAHIRLANCLSQLGRASEARSLLERAHFTLITAHGEGHPRAAEVAAQLAVLKNR